jgi:uncharacterized membrane protein
MTTKLFFGGLGIVQAIVGCILAWANFGHLIGGFGLIAVGALLVSGVLKILFGFVYESVVNLQRTIGGSFLLEGVYFGTGYQFLVEVGVYEARLWVYVLVTLCALILMVVGIGVLRDRSAFPGFFPKQS